MGVRVSLILQNRDIDSDFDFDFDIKKARERSALVTNHAINTLKRSFRVLLE